MASPDAPASAAGRRRQQQLLSKQQILDLVKPLLKRRLAEGLLHRASYKLAAKAATSSLFERQLATQRPFAGGADGEEAVQQAVQGVLDSGLH